MAVPLEERQEPLPDFGSLHRRWSLGAGARGLHPVDERSKRVRDLVLADRQLAAAALVLNREVVLEAVRSLALDRRVGEQLREVGLLDQGLDLARFLLGKLGAVELPELGAQAGVAAASCQLNAQ
jgi:hypothetical protein